MAFAHKSPNGFSIVELLVVGALLTILALSIFILINPTELRARTRDGQRLADMLLLEQAIEQYVGDNKNIPPDTSGVIRQSNLATASGIPANVNGTGWIPVNLSGYLEKLPIDPLNTGNYVYRYYRSGNTYKIDMMLEYYTNKMANTKDGGIDNCHYESGSNLSLVLPNGC